MRTGVGWRIVSSLQQCFFCFLFFLFILVEAHNNTHGCTPPCLCAVSFLCVSVCALPSVLLMSAEFTKLLLSKLLVAKLI
jgi:hypothetical protein